LNGIGLDEGTWTDIGMDAPGVAVRLTPAVHHSRPMPIRPNEASGHLVRCRSEGVVWLAGDTSLYPELGTMAEPSPDAVDVAVVPIGGWGPKLSPGHMGPVEAATACREVGARWAVPVHWGTLYAPWLPDVPRGWMDRPGPLFEAALAETAPRCAFLHTRPGGTVRVTPGPSGATSPWAGDPR
jgi:L-ascorbate metabolism protein UlaG (beta-lactamase superfamily)